MRLRGATAGIHGEMIGKRMMYPLPTVHAAWQEKALVTSGPVQFSHATSGEFSTQGVSRGCGELKLSKSGEKRFILRSRLSRNRSRHLRKIWVFSCLTEPVLALN